MNDLIPLLFLSAPLVPFFIIHLIGATLCIRHWPLHPTRWCFAFVAFLLNLIRLLGTVATHWMTLRVVDAAWDAKTLRYFIGVISSVDVAIAIVAWILLLFALFSKTSTSVPMAAYGFSENPERVREMTE